jgi:hypothetical protein
VGPTAETYSIDSPANALVAATAKTCIEIATPATQTNRIIDLTVGADAVVSGTLKVELITLAATGTGTAYTPKKCNGEAQNRAANTTGKITDTAEGTTPTVLKTYLFPLPLGGFEIQLPLGRERYMPVSTIVGVRLTASVACNGYAYVEFEE